MSPTFLTLPRELRDRIYDYVWSDTSSVWLRYASFKDELCFEAHDLRFPEQVVKRYPPPGYTAPEPTAARKDSLADDVASAPAAASPEKEACPQSSRRDNNTIEFDLEAFLDEWSECDDEDDSSDEEDENEAGGKNEQQLKRQFNLESWLPLPTSLFTVNRQLRNETLQFFFSTRNIILDADGVASIRFLWQLPTIVREAITTISLGSFALQTDDKYSSAAWFGVAEEPEYRDASGLTLITPFAAFLASHLPKLNHINLYLPYSGTEDWYPTLAPIELSLLLKFHRIKSLNFIFMGEDVVKTLRNGKLRSRECYEKLMGGFKDCERLAEHEFELEHPAPEMRSFDKKSHGKMMEYVKTRHEYVEGNRREFPWKWARRDVEMGSDGNVQAVVRCWVE
ncbi:uncharacterized protein MYCFIDRAFT_211299 [Pseudocercospora fijiensis CIRAD86]|uniref:Uncharacterized protein n=1 Tax=Pseudocercospora fijiensis (strain CIRAD86) TaxID=383855 RepID=M3B1T5_PSEFD|nr:uncharacterized protein MYCFIDRAFT_211299 [Pseudocercospora fijiensis CIRAD86]EME83318.1 hypothetical protein MYCFIDRAFT_211299 [Pseudocercospora fijiensis CIRAD86]